MTKAFFAFVLFFHACQDHSVSVPTCKAPIWLESEKASIIQQGHKGQITKYRYKNQEVYLIEGCLQNCADYMDVVKDCSGNVVCEMGGIAGINTCIDFDKAVKLEEVWKN